MFLLILVAILVIIFLLGQALFRNVKNPMKKIQYSIGFTAVGFLTCLFLFVYFGLYKPDKDKELEQDVYACKGFTGKIAFDDLVGKWQVPWGFFTIDNNAKVTEKYMVDGKQNSGEVSVEGNLLTYLRLKETKDTIRNVYKICDFNKSKFQARLIFTSDGEIAEDHNIEWSKVEQ